MRKCSQRSSGSGIENRVPDPPTFFDEPMTAVTMVPLPATSDLRRVLRKSRAPPDTVFPTGREVYEVQVNTHVHVVSQAPLRRESRKREFDRISDQAAVTSKSDLSFFILKYSRAGNLKKNHR